MNKRGITKRNNVGNKLNEKEEEAHSLYALSFECLYYLWDITNSEKDGRRPTEHGG